MMCCAWCWKEVDPSKRHVLLELGGEGHSFCSYACSVEAKDFFDEHGHLRHTVRKPPPVPLTAA